MGKGQVKCFVITPSDTQGKKGYSGIQFNMVVSTNVTAVTLWQKFGFEIIGTTPNGFRHMELGFVDTYMMFKDLTTDD